MQAAQAQILEEFMRTLSSELLLLVPKVVTATLIVIVAYVSLKILGYVLKKILAFVDVDKFVNRHVGRVIPFSFNKLITILVYLAVVLTAVYGVLSVFLAGEYMEAVSSFILYGTRMVSIIVVSLILFTFFTLVIDRIMGESRLKGYLMFIITLLITAMMIDVTTLSEAVKQSLYTGLSIGIGASLAIFAIWFFFHEYLEKHFTSEKKRK